MIAATVPAGELAEKLRRLASIETSVLYSARTTLLAAADALAARPAITAGTDAGALEGLREALKLIDAFGNEPGERATVLLEKKDGSTFELIDGRSNKPLRLSDLRKIAAITPETAEAVPVADQIASLTALVKEIMIRVENDRTLWTPDWQTWLVDARRATETLTPEAVPVAAEPSPAAKSGEAGLQASFSEAFFTSEVGGGDDAILKIRFPTVRAMQDARSCLLAALATPSPQPADAVREALEAAVRLTVQDASWHLRKYRPHCLAALEAALSEPAPAGEAVEPVYRFLKLGEAIQPTDEWLADGYQRWQAAGSDWKDRHFTENMRAFRRPIAHPAPDDTARLREDLDQAKRDRDMFSDWFKAERQEKIAAERERDDARKALETAREDEREAFRAGWKINAVGTDVHPQEYLDGCEEVDWENYTSNRAALRASHAGSPTDGE